MLYAELRAEVCEMNKELARQNLVVWTGGNVSGIVRSAGHVIIKPSGVRFEYLTPDSMVVTDLEGKVVEGSFKPSVELEVHNYIYQHRDDIGGICHTHSPYATSFALLGKPIPAALTHLVHLLGREVPCTGYVRPAHLDTGMAIIDTVGDGVAVLVNRHGTFTFGKTPTESVKIAAFLEEAAQTIHYAMLRGEVTSLPQEELERSFQWYNMNYGQKRA